jgi:hypothetical protein
MPRHIGGLSKMIDNQVTVDRVLSVDESLRALCRVNTPMERSAVSTLLMRR